MCRTSICNRPQTGYVFAHGCGNVYVRGLGDVRRSNNETRLETMSDPWLSIPLADYEGHMGADGKTLWLGIFSAAAIGS
jgi:hypothetical protein